MKWLVWVLIAVEAVFVACVLLFGAGLHGLAAVLLVVGTVVFVMSFCATYLMARAYENRIDRAAGMMMTVLESDGNAISISSMVNALDHDDLTATQRRVEAQRASLWAGRVRRGEASDR